MTTKRKYFFWEEVTEEEAKKAGFELLKTATISGYAIAKLTNAPIHVCIPADENQKLKGAVFVAEDEAEEFKLRYSFEVFGFKIDQITIDGEDCNVFAYKGKDYNPPLHILKKTMADLVLQTMLKDPTASVPSETFTYARGNIIEQLEHTHAEDIEPINNWMEEDDDEDY